MGTPKSNKLGLIYRWDEKRSVRLCPARHLNTIFPRFVDRWARMGTRMGVRNYSHLSLEIDTHHTLW
jgi:hypothetical protein